MEPKNFKEPPEKVVPEELVEDSPRFHEVKDESGQVPVPVPQKNTGRSLADTLRLTKSRILPPLDAPPRTLLPRRLAAHAVDACVIALICTVIYLLVGISQDLNGRRSLASVLAYFTGLSNDFASGFFTIEAVFAGLLAIFLLSLINAVFPGCISILAFFALLASAGDFSVDDLSPRHYLFVQIVFLLCPLAYNVVLEKIFHTTIGKWLMGLGLNLYGEDGNRLKTEPGWLNLMAREVLRMLYIDFVLLWWYPLSFAFKWKRAERMLYDRLALTGVVEEVVDKEPGQSAFFRKRARFVLFTACGAMLSLVYLGVLQEPVHLALNKIYLKVAKIADPKLYTEGLIRSIVYHDQIYYQSKGDLTAINSDIDQLNRVLSVMKSRQVDERRRCRLNLALALLYETRALSASSEALSKRDNLAAAANFETYVEVKDRNGLAVEDNTLNLDRDWHVPSILYQMSELFLRLERYEDAVKIAERALASKDTRDSVKPFLYYVEVRAFEKLDNKDGMISTLERLRDRYRQELDTALASKGSRQVVTVYQDLFQTRLRLTKLYMEENRRLDARKEVEAARSLHIKMADQLGESFKVYSKELDEFLSRLKAG